MLLTRRLYYHAKPFLPSNLLAMLRRVHVRQILRRSGAVWPILPGSERAPNGWPGWPEGKGFALVLTHDVESARGLERVKQLADLEMELGFRSSFNLVPEGDYVVPPTLRIWLSDHGFEVGVHDLNHDGKLYCSKKSFSRKAARINRYLKEWNAVGFRSAFMLHNYDWLHELNVLYEGSSFDTDPFEPQPEGVNTIFPFWVPAPQAQAGSREQGAPRSEVDFLNNQPSAINHSDPLNSQLSTLNHPRSGYVELPYTLPQDSTLFLLLAEQSIDIWKKKLEWLAAQGGMALLNVHPDYMSSSDTQRDGAEYPAKRYREFLQYLRERFAGEYWHACPAAIAEFCCGLEWPKENFVQRFRCRRASQGAPNAQPFVLEDSSIR